MGLLESAAGAKEKLSGKPKELKYQHFAGFVVDSVNRQLENVPAESLIVPLKRAVHATKTREFLRTVGALADVRLGGTGVNFDLAGSIHESQSLEIVGMNYTPVPVWKPDLICFVFQRQPVAQVIEVEFGRQPAVEIAVVSQAA